MHGVFCTFERAKQNSGRSVQHSVKASSCSWRTVHVFLGLCLVRQVITCKPQGVANLQCCVVVNSLQLGAICTLILKQEQTCTAAVEQ